MKPEAAFFMAKAREFIAKAPEMQRMGFADEAARAAYMAGLNAARGLIFERTDTVSKTHGGTHSRFAELTRDDVLAGPTRKFLGSAYDLKISCDYGTGPVAVVTEAEADAAIATAKTLLAAIDDMLATNETKEPP